MIKKTCPNGHIYDQNIYGDTCPLCPPTTAHPDFSGQSQETKVTPGAPSGAHTRVVSPSNPAMGGYPGMPGGMPNYDPTGSTHVKSDFSQNKGGGQPEQGTTARTTIRRNPAMAGPGVKNDVQGRKLVGFLVTYNRTPMGKAFNIYEGRNYIGRDASCDISVPDDNQMSGKHLLIRYLSGNNKFSFKDEMSSNGTYVNKELLDEGELQSYDIIRVGSTIFIFIAIPQI